MYAAAVLIKDKPIPNVFQYTTNYLNATPMFEYGATLSQQIIVLKGNGHAVLTEGSGV